MRKIVRSRDIAQSNMRARNIGDGIEGAAPAVDSIYSRIAKYIPAETVTVYASLQSFAVPYLQDTLAVQPAQAFMAFVGGCLVFNILYMLKTGWLQLFASTAAFALWVLLLGGDTVNEIFDSQFGEDARRQLVGAILIGWSVGVPLVDRLFDRRN